MLASKSAILSIALILALTAAAARHAQPLALAAIHGYQRTLAPLTARAGIVCRFVPSCSRYAEIVITRDGVVSGGWKTVKRIVRCGPWTAAGTVDRP